MPLTSNTIKPSYLRIAGALLLGQSGPGQMVRWCMPPKKKEPRGLASKMRMRTMASCTSGDMLSRGTRAINSRRKTSPHWHLSGPMHDDLHSAVDHIVNTRNWKHAVGVLRERGQIPRRLGQGFYNGSENGFLHCRSRGFCDSVSVARGAHKSATQKTKSRASPSD
jgi:hypothetical protein